MKTVLTVDDSKVVRSMVARCLEGYDCRVVEATNGREGVEAARQHRPDLILLDVTMPVMDGREALAELRKDPASASIPVIMLTAESGRELVVEIAKLGVAGYIVKPFQKETFHQAVSKVLGSPGAAPPPPVDPQTVLVVDDSERVLEAARAALGDGVRLITADSGTAAVERYREARPGVVVIDLKMPDLDGFATLARIRELGRSVYIALAVRGEPGVHERARQAGYHAVLAKPFSAEELRAQVRAAMESLASPDDLLRSVLGTEGECSVLSLPDAGSKTFGKIAPALPQTLRTLAEDGSDKLIVDVGNVVEVNAEVVSFLVRLISEATRVGIRTAICARNPEIVERLRAIAETKNTPYAATREAARQSLLSGS